MLHPSQSEVRPATILVYVQLQKTAAEEHTASLQELRQLVETLGWDIVGTLTQKLQSPTAASLIGPGKLNELSELVKAPSMAESVVFDHELTPTQVRNIREATGVEVYDRPAIILEIFHRHARTKEAQLQVELARLSSLVRNVLFLTSLEVYIFLICCCRFGVLRSKALRRGLCGAFRAKRRWTPQPGLTPAIDSTSAASFSAHNLATMDDPAHPYYFLLS